MIRLEAWKRPQDWRVAVYSTYGESYGYSTWPLVAAVRALFVYLKVRRQNRRDAAHSQTKENT